MAQVGQPQGVAPTEDPPPGTQSTVELLAKNWDGFPVFSVRWWCREVSAFAHFFPWTYGAG